MAGTGPSTGRISSQHCATAHITGDTGHVLGSRLRDQCFLWELLPWAAVGCITLGRALPPSGPGSVPICHEGGPPLSHLPVWLRKQPQVRGSATWGSQCHHAAGVPGVLGDRRPLATCPGSSLMQLRTQAEAKEGAPATPRPAGCSRRALAGFREQSGSGWSWRGTRQPHGPLTDTDLAS